MEIEHKYTKSVLVASFLVAVLSACCAILGFFDKNLYDSVIATGVFKISFMPGTISQDLVTIAASILMMFLIVVYLKSKDGRVLISIVGLLSFYFYGYGTYVISALYTSVYMVYMLIFTLSSFGLIMGIGGFTGESVKRLHLPKWVRISSVIFLAAIVLIFTGKWTTDLIPYTQSHTVPDFYAIYILDLCIVMPFFAGIVYMLVKNVQFAYILLGIALLKTTTLILSVSIGSFIAPLYGMQDEAGMVITYCSISVISLLMFVLYYRELR
jgi:hypothetical protein